MRKREELSRADACLQRAHPEEMVFVLLGRDPAAPAAIRAWVAERLRTGKNIHTDPEITEALESARVMEAEGRRWKEALGRQTPVPGHSFSVAEVNARCAASHTYPSGATVCWCGKATRPHAVAATEVAARALT